MQPRYVLPLPLSLLKAVLLTLCSLQLVAGAAMADEAVAATTAEETVRLHDVQVEGMRDPDWKSYKAMLQGVAAFDAKHQLAPTATLRFILSPRRPDVPMQGISLRLESAESAVPVDIAPDYTFSLPVSEAAQQANAELVLNRKVKTVRWFPHVRSAGLAPNQRRLGDLRLECEVIWAIDYDTIPFLMRNMIRALGGPCHMSKGKFSFRAPERLISATLVAGERRAALEVSAYQFTPPLHDQSWADDSLIELVFAAGTGLPPAAD